MTDSTSTSYTTSATTSINTNCRRKTRGVAMYTKVKKAHETGVRYPVTVDAATGMAYGEHANDFMGYIVLQYRSKDDLVEQIKVGFFTSQDRHDILENEKHDRKLEEERKRWMEEQDRKLEEDKKRWREKHNRKLEEDGKMFEEEEEKRWREENDRKLEEERRWLLSTMWESV
ncbi:uncharacterized protein LOC127079195 [Lathyrus oleraceus]|uniref:uncharacterized protein LOC127079195 n=1 Tax=Pisum sativum TaxID=3888 RepID=UPI0021D23BA2|nr:uncharacterized protein LOC127079195 [Pisum sativum]